MKELFNKKAPILGFTIITLYYLWALWTEIPLTATIYEVCVMLMFAWVIIMFLSNKGKNIYQASITIVEIFSLVFWCILMFVAYQLRGVHTVVEFFGVEMDSYARIMLYWILAIVPGIALSSFCTLKDNKRFRMILTVVILTSLIYSVRATIVFPDALRARSTAESLGYEALLFGLPTYSMVYSYALVMPWFLCRIHSTSGKTRWFFLTLTACLAFIIVISQFATALLAMVVGVLVYVFIYNMKDGRAGISILLFVILATLFLSGIVGDIFYALAEVSEGSWSEKLVELGGYFSGGSAKGDLGTRFDLYSISWDAFGDSPLFGVLLGNKASLGGHASLLDSLALCGLFGFVFWVGMMAFSFKKLMYDGKDYKTRCSMFAAFAAYIFLWVTKNIISALAVTFTWFVLIPMLYSLEADDESHKKTDL